MDESPERYACFCPENHFQTGKLVVACAMENSN